MAGESKFLDRVAGESMLEVTQFLDRVRDELEPEGSGVLYIPNAISKDECQELYSRLTNPSVEWLDARQKFVNQRGIEVTQNFSTYALKMSQLTDVDSEAEIGIISLARRAKSLVHSLDGIFPMLANWEVDEAVAQRYDQGETGLTWHKDNERHQGLIVSASISGQAEIYHRMYETEEPKKLYVGPGDMIILRGGFLHGSWYHDLRPEHRVDNVIDDRISLTFRANNRPNEPIPGVSYNNWNVTDDGQG
ncbi:MAG TPA: alpha-ketoglutarate-dependent dioxygenase AlkB [Candidatus Saccharimonadales bacterium]|nr:alpha-ketoglutarate-dependent dioxygenase AlkB [Candidatus Saccharimonadales bacterium]